MKDFLSEAAGIEGFEIGPAGGLVGFGVKAALGNQIGVAVAGIIALDGAWADEHAVDAIVLEFVA